jgi:nicotinamide-nucleotide amidase
MSAPGADMSSLLDADLATQWVAPLADALRARGWRLATAESCTGGLIAATCTSLAGSSDWYERGFVTYSNTAKTEQLGVDTLLIAQHGAVSEPVVLAMAEGALSHSPADIALAVTGIAGPGGAAPGKPVGMVWLAIAQRGAAARAECLQLAGDRAAVREQTVVAALARALQLATA